MRVAELPLSWEEALALFRSGGVRAFDTFQCPYCGVWITTREEHKPGPCPTCGKTVELNGGRLIPV